jgi:basic amino acid/polyamine antiporter, APA family
MHVGDGRRPCHEPADGVGGAVWLPFLVALVLALFTACSYAELVTKYPCAGGAAL